MAENWMSLEEASYMISDLLKNSKESLKIIDSTLFGLAAKF